MSLILIPDGAWKSAVIIAGSILEAILSDRLTSNPEILSKAKSSTKAPKKNGRVKEVNDWTLQKLIEVSVDIDLLPSNRASSIDQVLRDYRNFVHPNKELRSQHPCSEAEALMAKGGLMVYVTFWKNLNLLH